MLSGTPKVFTRGARRGRLAGLAKCGLLMACLWPCAGVAATVDRQIVHDLDGSQVQVPLHPQRIADLWFAHNEIMVMLGAADRIRMTVDRPETTPWMFRFAPELARARQVRGVANPEALLADHVDLAIVPSSPQADSYRRLGIPTLAMSFQTPEGLIQSVQLTARVLNTAQAIARADAYQHQLQQLIAVLDQRLAALPTRQRPSVLHIESLAPLRVDGSNTLIDQWIRHAGGRNAAGSIKGNKQAVDFEQILAWQPDVIIMAANAVDSRQHLTSSWWQSLHAVRDHKVYRNPMGIFLWDRYGSEFLLQLAWAAKTLHSQTFQDFDMAALARQFYSDYFHYRLSDHDLNQMLQGLPPNTP